MPGANGANSGSSMSAAEAAKKARFVSDGNINVSSLGMSSAGGAAGSGSPGAMQSNNAGYTGMPGSAPAGAHHGFSASLGSIASAGNSPQASRRNGSQSGASGYNGAGPGSAGGNRGFSGGAGYNGMQSMGTGAMGMTQGNGSPSQTYHQQQPYGGSPPSVPGQPAALSIPPNPSNMPSLGSPGASPNGGGFSPASTAASPFMLNMMPAMLGNGNGGSQSAGPGGMMGMPNMQGMLPNAGHQSAGVYGTFPNSPFAGGASPGMGTFMPNVGMLAGGQAVSFEREKKSRTKRSTGFSIFSTLNFLSFFFLSPLLLNLPTWSGKRYWSYCLRWKSPS